MKRISSTALILKKGFVAVVLAFALIVYQPKSVECVSNEDSLNTERRSIILSEKWLSAVANNDQETALSIAEKLVPDPSNIISPNHIQLLEKHGIKRSFLTAPFDRWDFQLWRDAYFFKQLSQEITNGDPDNVNAIFEAVRNRIAPHEGMRSESVLPWPYGIWKRGFGVCDRQSWVLAELAYQAGWETQVVYLIDPETISTDHPIAPHTVSELRKPGGLVYFADPYGDILFQGKSIDDVAADQGLSATLWPDHQDWTRSLQDYIYWTPSYPQDYRQRNQELYKIIKKSLNSRCPKFGVPPDDRLTIYFVMRQMDAVRKGSSIPRFPMRLWKRPIQLLNADIKRYADEGPSFYLKGNFKEAIAHYSEALHLRSRAEVVHYDLGEALTKQGKLKEAISHYNEALDINPTFTQAKQHLQWTLQRSRRLGSL